eukprot:958221-Prorocentrum_lima.AAC.1
MEKSPELQGGSRDPVDLPVLHGVKRSRRVYTALKEEVVKEAMTGELRGGCAGVAKSLQRFRKH